MHDQPHHITYFFAYRIKAQKQFASQLFPTTTPEVSQETIWDRRTTTKNWEENVLKMCKLIAEHSMLTTDIEINRGLINIFTNTHATQAQTQDLLNARQVGEQVYANFVTHYILQLPSVQNAPVRRKQLLTMAPLKTTKKHITQQQKEQWDINKYLRKRLAWCNQTGCQFDESKEQYSLLPRPLAELDGSPHKGN